MHLTAASVLGRDETAVFIGGETDEQRKRKKKGGKEKQREKEMRKEGKDSWTEEKKGRKKGGTASSCDGLEVRSG